MRCRFMCTLLTAALISEKIIAGRTSERPRRAPGENFNILLNLYKIKPMKHSNVFKSFSDTMLLPYKDERNVLNFDSNENTRIEMSGNNNGELKYLEEQLHVTSQPLRTQIQEIIKAPSYGKPEKFEKVIANELFIDSVSSTEAEKIEYEQNKENRIEENNYKKISKKRAYFVPDRTYNGYNNNEYNNGQWEANLESEKEKHYNSSRKRDIENSIQNKLNITIMIPVNTTVERYMDSTKLKVAPTKEILHFYDDPINRIEDISKEDDSSVIVIR